MISKLKSSKIKFSDYSFVISFLVLVVIATFFKRDYLSFQNLSTLMLQASIKGIIALGMTLIIISGMIDLSVGSTVALVGGLGVVVLNSTRSIIITLIFCAAFGCVLGAINGILVTKGKIAPFIVTLATMSAYRSIIVQLGQGGPFNVDVGVLESFRKIASGGIKIGLGKQVEISYLSIIFVFITICIWFLANKLKLGTYIYSVGSNEKAARLTGINVDTVKILTFSITGFLCGISAFLLSSRLTSITAPNAGTSFELDAIAAVAIGGTSMSGGRGKIIGTFFGAIMIQMIESILIAAKIPPFLAGLVKGIVIIVAVLLQNVRTKSE